METKKMTVEFDINAEFRTLVAEYLEHSAKGDITGEPANDEEIRIWIEETISDSLQEIRWEKVFRTEKCNRCGTTVEFDHDPIDGKVRATRFNCPNPNCKTWGFRI